MTREQPAALTTMQIVTWHVANAEADDPRLRGDVEFARRYLAERVAAGQVTEAEANEIRRAVGWDVTAVQLELF